MAKMIRCALLLLCGVLFLSACGPMYQTSYTYTPPVSMRGKMCVMQCQKQKSLCERLAQSNQTNCKLRARDDARFKYESYVSRQRSKGRKVKKTLEDFYSPWACRSSARSSGCTNDYRACYQLCGGKISSRRQCVAFCDKQKASRKYQKTEEV